MKLALEEKYRTTIKTTDISLGIDFLPAWWNQTNTWNNAGQDVWLNAASPCIKTLILELQITGEKRYDE